MIKPTEEDIVVFVVSALKQLISKFDHWPPPNIWIFSSNIPNSVISLKIPTQKFKENQILDCLIENVDISNNIRKKLIENIKNTLN